MNKFPLELGDPSSGTNKFPTITKVQSKGNYTSNLTTQISQCYITKIDKFGDVHKPYSTIKLANGERNYVRYANKKYTLDNIKIYYTNVHKIYNIQTHLEMGMIFSHSRIDLIYIFIPLVKGHSTSSNFFIDILKGIDNLSQGSNNNDINNQPVNIDSQFNLGSLIPDNANYYFYESPDGITTEMTLADGKKVKGAELNAMKVFVYHDPIYLNESEYNKFANYNTIGAVYTKNIPVDISQIYYYKAKHTALNSIQTAMGNGWYLDCGKTEDLKGGGYSQEQIGGETQPETTRGRLLSLFSLILGLIILPIFHIVGQSVFELDGYGLIALDCVPILLMFIIILFYNPKDTTNIKDKEKTNKENTRKNVMIVSSVLFGLLIVTFIVKSFITK